MAVSRAKAAPAAPLHSKYRAPVVRLPVLRYGRARHAPRPERDPQPVEDDVRQEPLRDDERVERAGDAGDAGEGDERQHRDVRGVVRARARAVRRGHGARAVARSRSPRGRDVTAVHAVVKSRGHSCEWRFKKNFGRQTCSPTSKLAVHTRGFAALSARSHERRRLIPELITRRALRAVPSRP